MSQLPGNDLLSQIENENPKLGQYLRQYLVPAITTTAKNAAVSPIGSVAAPDAPSAVNVAAFGEMVHVSVQDNSPLNRGVNYFTEIGVDDPHFTQPIVFHHGTSRTPPPFPLPTNVSGGGSPVAHKYYIRSYSQYPGGPPSEKTVYNNGAAVTLSGIDGRNAITLNRQRHSIGDRNTGRTGLRKSPNTSIMKHEGWAALNRALLRLRKRTVPMRLESLHGPF